MPVIPLQLIVAILLTTGQRLFPLHPTDENSLLAPRPVVQWQTRFIDAKRTLKQDAAIRQEPLLQLAS